MKKKDCFDLLTTPRDMLRDLCEYTLIFLLRKVVVFKSKSAYCFFVTSTRKVLLWAVFTDLGATFAERNLSIAKGESLVRGLSTIDSRTMKLEKEVITSKTVNVSVSGWDLLGNLFNISRRVGFSLHKLCLLFDFSLVQCSITHHEVQLCRELTLSLWLKRGYTTGVRESRVRLRSPANLRLPVPHTLLPTIQQRSKSHPLNSIDPQAPPSITYKIKKRLRYSLPQVQFEFDRN